MKQDVRYFVITASGRFRILASSDEEARQKFMDNWVNGSWRMSSWFRLTKETREVLACET